MNELAAYSIAMRKLLLSTLLLSSLLVAVPAMAQVSPPASPGHKQVDRQSLLAAALAFADSSRTGTLADAVTRMLAADGILISPAAEVIRGRDNARLHLSADTQSGRANMTWHLIRGDVSADGKHGYTYGYFDIRLPDGRTRGGKYSAFWRREADGRWLVMALRRVGRSSSSIAYDVPPFISASASPRYAAQRGNIEALRDSVAAADVAFSDRVRSAGAADAFFAYAAPDAAHISAGDAIVFGADAIASPLRDMPAGSTFSWSPELVELATGGDLAYSTGIVESRERQADGSERVVGTFRYFTIWQRQADGSWKFIVEG